MTNLLVLCLCFLSAFVSVRAQSECDIVQASDLGNSTASRGGAIGVFLGRSDVAGLPTITLENVEIISLAVGTVQNKFRWASVIATYNCSGEGCPDDTYPRTDQFDLQCLNDSGGDPMWLVNDRSDPTNSSLTTDDLRRDCSVCLNPVNATDFGLPPGTTVDAAFHCAGTK